MPRFPDRWILSDNSQRSDSLPQRPRSAASRHVFPGGWGNELPQIAGSSSGEGTSARHAIERQYTETDRQKLQFEYKQFSEPFVRQLTQYVNDNNQNSAFAEEIREIAIILDRTKIKKNSDL